MIRFKEPLILVCDNVEIVLPSEFEDIRDLKAKAILATYEAQKKLCPSITRAAAETAVLCGFQDGSAIFKIIRKIEGQ